MSLASVNDAAETAVKPVKKRVQKRIRRAKLDRRTTLVRRSLERFRLPYITITPTFSICPRHGYLKGEHEFCPKCDELKLAEKLRGLAA